MIPGVGDGSLGDHLTSRRRDRFVGRAHEIARFTDALADGPAVLHVHGPGGIGKTSLLEVFERLTVDAGRVCVRLDGRLGPPGLDRLGGFDEPTVVLVDGCEAVRRPDAWLRDVLGPLLPAGSVVVLAGRTPPPPDSDAEPMRLGGLTDAECATYLLAAGVDEARHDAIIRVAAGHPLGLALLADLVRRGGLVGEDMLAPDLVAALVRRFVDVAVPDALHLEALAVCALARSTNEPMLRDALGVQDAHALFEWLRGLSFMEAGADGLCPHDLARDVLAADLRWRDPQAYTRIFHGIRDHVLGRLTAARGRERQRVILDAKYMHRHQSASRMFSDWDTFGEQLVEPARAEDLPQVLRMVDAWEGSESAGIAEHWWKCQPAAFHVVRRADDELQGVLAMLDLSSATDAELERDPGARAAWRHAGDRSGATVTHLRFCVDVDAHQKPSPTVNLGPVLCIQDWLERPGLARSYLTFAEADAWTQYFSMFEIRRVGDADFEVGGHRYGSFVRDFDELPVEAWLRLMLERDLAGPDAGAPAGSRLTAAEFAGAVRSALRELNRPHMLAANPLAVTLGSADALAEAVRLSAQTLLSDPRDDKLFRVIDRTYLRPAATQELAAQVLDLPMTTYKRHLRRALERIVAEMARRVP